MSPTLELGLTSQKATKRCAFRVRESPHQVTFPYQYPRRRKCHARGDRRGHARFAPSTTPHQAGVPPGGGCGEDRPTLLRLHLPTPTAPRVRSPPPPRGRRPLPGIRGLPLVPRGTPSHTPSAQAPPSSPPETGGEGEGSRRGRADALKTGACAPGAGYPSLRVQKHRGH